MNKKTLFVTLLSIAASLCILKTVSAHAVVTPKQAIPGEFVNFSLGIPSENTTSTTGVRLVIPSGLAHVTPVVKSGWKVDVKEEDGLVAEILWTGGSIPSKQKDIFMFSAQVPTSETVLKWKVYQAYEDGSVVAWDKGPEMGNEVHAANSGPYSTTEIAKNIALEKEVDFSKLALALSAISLVLSLFVLIRK